MLMLPPINEVPSEFSVEMLWQFRLASLGTEAVLWTTLGLVFGFVAERHLAGPGRYVDRAWLFRRATADCVSHCASSHFRKVTDNKLAAAASRSPES